MAMSRYDLIGSLAPHARRASFAPDEAGQLGLRRQPCKTPGKATVMLTSELVVRATCKPAIAAMKLARNATSVLPKPTSPQVRPPISMPEAHIDDRAQLVPDLVMRKAGGKLS